MKRIAAVMAVCLSVMCGVATAAPSATQQAIAEYNQENYEEALQMLTSARQVEGETALNRYYTGLCQKQTGDLAGAVASLKAALQAQPPVQDAAVELVALLINLEQLADAWQWVEWAEKEQVRPRDVAYLKGVLLAKQKRYHEAVVSFQNARTGLAETDQQIDLQIALAYAQSGKTRDARDSLKAIVTRYPGTEAADFAAEYDQRISTAAPHKRWNIYAGISYLYDDNATLKSRESGASSDTRDQRDSAVSEYLRLEYDTPLAGQWSANLQYALQNNNYMRLHDYSMLVHGLTTSLIGRSENGLLALPLNLSHTTLDYRDYSFQVSFKPTLTALFNSRNLAQLSLGYTHRDMLQNNGLPGNDRTANIFNLQAGYIYLFADGRGLVNLRGEGFYENTTGNEWRNRGARAGVDLLAPLSAGTKLILTAEGCRQEYLDSSSGRRDTTLVASATLNQQLTTHLYLNLQYYFTRAFSNVDLYDYQRNVITTGVELRF